MGAALAGLFCYHFGAMINFYALTLIDASLERVLLFTYPSMVVLVHSVMHRQLPDSRTVLALLATFLGILAAVSGLDAHIFRANMHGALLVLICASTTTVYFLASDRWTPQVGSAAFTVWAMTAASLGLGLQALLVRSARPPVPGQTDLPLLLGLVGIATVFAMLMTAEGVRRLGAQRASVISTVGPPATILLAVPLLGERMNLAQWLGVVLILAGILFMELSRTGASTKRNPVPPGRN
jgi:drug/metabolite transporter (DMT)-like permease